MTRHKGFSALAVGIGTLATALGTALAMTMPAAAATGANVYSAEQAGYSATGAQFRYVKTTVYLRDPAQYSAEVAKYGYSVQLRSANYVVVFGVSAATSGASGYNPAATIYNASTHAVVATSTNGSVPAQWCPAVGSCHPATAGGSFPASDSLTENIYYDTITSLAHFTAVDPAGNQFTGSVRIAGQSFGDARVGADFAATPWTPAQVTSPSQTIKVGSFSNAALTSYTGHRATFTSWWASHKVIMTGPGSVVEGTPSVLSNGGANFDASLVPFTLPGRAG